MNTAHIDTLQHANKLKAAGFNDTQAVAIIELQAEAIDTALEQARHDYRLDEISTRGDLKELETILKRDLPSIGNRPKARHRTAQGRHRPPDCRNQGRFNPLDYQRGLSANRPNCRYPA